MESLENVLEGTTPTGDDISPKTLPSWIVGTVMFSTAIGIGLFVYRQFSNQVKEQTGVDASMPEF